jgi:hypothetical protein
MQHIAARDFWLSLDPAAEAKHEVGELAPVIWRLRSGASSPTYAIEVTTGASIDRRRGERFAELVTRVELISSTPCFAAAEVEHRSASWRRRSPRQSRKDFHDGAVGLDAHGSIWTPVASRVRQRPSRRPRLHQAGARRGA